MSERPAETYRPESFGLDKEFYELAARSGSVHVQSCELCGEFQHPPRFVCHSCSSRQFTWQQIAGVGNVYSWALSHFTIDKAWSESLPYATVVVESLEGVRFVGTYSGVQGELRIGLPVDIRLEVIDEGFVYIWFDPSAETEAQ